jgi:hypothetical protein
MLRVLDHEAMAKRDDIQLDLIWVHVDMTHRRAEDFLAAAEAQIEQVIPGAELSVNRNIAGTEALVKVTGTTDFVTSLPGLVQNAVIRTFTEADHAEALAMVTTVEWQGEPEA